MWWWSYNVAWLTSFFLKYRLIFLHILSVLAVVLGNFSVMASSIIIAWMWWVARRIRKKWWMSLSMVVEVTLRRVTWRASPIRSVESLWYRRVWLFVQLEPFVEFIYLLFICFLFGYEHSRSPPKKAWHFIRNVVNYFYWLRNRYTMICYRFIITHLIIS